MAILETFPSKDNSHTILNDSGTAVAKEDNLQFVGFDVTDDSTNNKTKVKAVGLNSDSLDDVCTGEISSAFAQTGLCYSTQEQIIGKWIDGSTLYQKTYTATFNQRQILISLTSDILVKEIKGGVFSSNGKNMIPIGYGLDSSSEVDVYKDASGLQCQNAYYSSYPNIVVTIQYTKTS